MILGLKEDDFGGLSTMGLALISSGDIEEASNVLFTLEKQYAALASEITLFSGRNDPKPTSLELANFYALRGAVAEYNLKLYLNGGMKEAEEKDLIEKVLVSYQEAVKLAPRNEAFVDLRDQFLKFKSEQQSTTYH